MVNILLIIPYPGLNDKFKKLIQAVESPDIKIKTTHIYGTADHMIDQCDADIIIARGITGIAFKKKRPQLHVVDISMTSEDLLTALAEKKRRCRDGAVAIVVTNNVPCNPQTIQELTGIPVHIYNVSDEQDIDHALQDIRQKKIGSVIGGLTTCETCKQLGIDAVHIKTGEQAAERAFQEALNAAHTLNAERTKTYLLTAVLNNTRDAILAVNREGMLIASNRQAHWLFGSAMINAQTHIDEIYPNSMWNQTIQTSEESETIQTINDHLVLVSSKPMRIDAAVSGILFVIQHVEKIREVETKIRKELSQKGFVAKYHFGNILCRNEQMKKLIASAYKYSQADLNVLIVGETGTGKELFAQSIHNASKRSGELFVAVNCAAFPEQLLDSELFGYTEGSFSGAMKGGKIGLFELAHKGTIFLDEIGEMPMNLQAKLLRVLQEKEIRRIGDDKVIPIDVRVISATNINMKEKIRQGLFRADLYYRINLLNIKIPPLRERKEDIGEIFCSFVERYSKRAKLPVPHLEEDAIAQLKCYAWHGNIRELRNFSERIVVLNESGTICKQDIISAKASEEEDMMQDEPSDMEDAPTLTEAEMYHMLCAKKYPKAEIAKRLGISRTTLWRKYEQSKP